GSTRQSVRALSHSWPPAGGIPSTRREVLEGLTGHYTKGFGSRWGIRWLTTRSLIAKMLFLNGHLTPGKSVYGKHSYSSLRNIESRCSFPGSLKCAMSGTISTG